MSALLLGTCLGAAGLVLIGPAPVAAQASNVTLDISAQSLAGALRQLGAQTGLQIAFSSADVAGHNTPALSGSMSAQEALNILLAASGLEATFVGDSTVSISRPTADQAFTPYGSGSDGEALGTIVLSAEEQNKQAPGVSTITSEDLSRQPPARDVTEAIRKMPGVNLTGNSSSGSRGNNRQIDIRGMGPENTLILIDGKPVLSRNSVRYSMSGERDTRGDASWVLPEEIERIEVIRGPAAARYGSGASGGVVNIITTRPTEPTYSVGMFFSEPESKLEGSSRRYSFTAASPIGEDFAYRLSYGNSTTEPDGATINGELDEDGAATKPAGREGVRSSDIRALLSWEPTDSNRFTFEVTRSKQRNIYAGDVYFSYYAPSAALVGMIGSETNRMTRDTYALSHNGTYSFGDWENLIQLEKTHNRRLAEGLAGNGEGTIVTDPARMAWTDSYLDNIFAKSELRMPVELGFSQMVTIGAEYRGSNAEDEGSITRSGSLDPDFGIEMPELGTDRDATLKGWNAALYIESNILVGDTLTVTPGLRLDHDKNFGSNVSPSLNASWQANDNFLFKAGIARAFKSPNAYQLHEGYVYSSRGGGCYDLQGVMHGPCNIIGNPDLQPERSVNTELGVSYSNDRDWNLGATWFHNDYQNRILSGGDPVAVAYDAAGNPERYLFRWRNSGPATVKGLEGNLSIPVMETLVWSANATKMLESKLENGQQISLIPEHTVNTALEWQATESLGITFSATHYGKIKPLRGSEDEAIASATRKAYWLTNVTVNFDVNEDTRLVAGVNNLLDKQLFRDGIGGNTFNEAGRSVYLGLNARW